MTEEQTRGGRVQTWNQDQVISDGDGGEHRERGEGQEGSDDASKEWSGKSTGESEGSAMEEEATNAGGTELGRETRTATAWGMLESVAGELHGDERSGRGDTRKSPSAAADKAGARVPHGVRSAQRGGQGGRQEKRAGETSGVRGNDGCREASGMANKSPGVGGEEGGNEDSRVAKSPRGSRQGVGRGVELPQGNDTPGVTELPRGDKTPGVNTVGEIRGGKPMGGPRTVEPPIPQRGTAAENGSAENRPRHTAGTNVARPEHGALARREYGLLAPTGMVVIPDDAGEPSSKASHEATGDWDGRNPEEEVEETQQRALPARGNNVIRDEARGPT